MGSCVTKKSSKNHNHININQLTALSEKEILFIARNNPKFSFKMSVNKKDAETHNLEWLFTLAKAYF